MWGNVVMTKHLTVFATAVLVAAFSVPAAAEDGSSKQADRAERDWKLTLAEDARALHDDIAANHPGMEDPLNPDFRTKVETGLATALERAQSTTDVGGWWWALRSYVASFDDGHMQIGMRNNVGGLPARWPGFLTVYRGEDQVVADRIGDSDTLPPLGARLTECDGVAAERLAETHIGDFRGRWSLKAQRVLYGDWMFLNASNPWISEMKQCRFATNGLEKTYTLAWKPIEATDLAARRSRINARVTPTFGMSEFANGGVWLSMPSFDSEPGSEAFIAMTTLLAEAEAKQQVLREASVVVLDLRGNGGGSSHWSDNLATILWGTDCRKAHDVPSSEAVDWRASDANISELAAFVAKLKEGGGDADLIAWGDKAISGMRTAKAADRPFWREDDGGSAAQVQRPTGASSNPVRGRVYVLTDPSCASACLDAVDIWKAAGAIQIGQETSADTLYMEVRNAGLPSELAAIGVPMKVYRGRARGNNEPHRPAYPFHGAIADTVALKAWVATLQ